MIASITALSITLCGCILGFAAASVARESQSSLLLLERVWWRLKKRKAEERLVRLEGTDGLTFNNRATRQHILHELHKYEVATSAHTTKFFIMALPTLAASLSVYSFTISRSPYGAFAPLIATSATLAPLLALAGTSMALSSESRHRATGCYVVNAITCVTEDYKRLRKDGRDFERDLNETSPTPSNYHIPVMPLARSLETVAANLTLFGTKRIRPDGRHPVNELIEHTERAAHHVRLTRNKILSEGVGSLEPLPAQMEKLLTEFVHGRYHQLTEGTTAPTQSGVATATSVDKERRGLIVAITIGCMAPLLLTWAGIPEGVIVTLLGVLAGPGLYALGVRNRSSVDGSEGSTGNLGNASQDDTGA